MIFSFEDFEKTIKKAGAVPVSNIPSCPIKNNQICLVEYSNCDMGNKNECVQIYKFKLGKGFYYINIRFYGEKKKGFIRSEELTVQNLFNKEKELFENLAPIK